MRNHPALGQSLTKRRDFLKKAAGFVLCSLALGGQAVAAAKSPPNPLGYAKSACLNKEAMEKMGFKR